MRNSIAARQNEPKFIDRLAASRQVYGRALTLSWFQKGGAVISIAVGAIAAIWLPSLKWQAAVIGVSVAILDRRLLERAIQKCRDLGARIQELFDCELLQLEWRGTRVGSRPDAEEIRELSERYKKKKKKKGEGEESLRDWYPVAASEVPLEYARLICQRSNMRWDSSLRKTYALICDVGYSFVIGVFIVLALCMDWSFRGFVMYFAPYLPLALLFYRESEAQKQSAQNSERSKAMLESYWRGAVTGQSDSAKLTEHSRCLQDLLYDRRRSTPQTPPWLYFFYRGTYEQSMQVAAEQMVDEVKEAGKMGELTS